ncbi:entericidin EcnA/B family protein [Puniceibacterium sp. IMCC21224]|nr:entericidin EcnA/B family protein [Puniceibacterium sp. IMCC21224]
MKTILTIGCLLFMAGCGTIDGLGQDISGAARTVQRSL